MEIESERDIYLNKKKQIKETKVKGGKDKEEIEWKWRTSGWGRCRDHAD